MSYKKFIISLVVIIVMIAFGYYQRTTAFSDKIVITEADSLKVNLQKQVASIFNANCSTAGCHKGKYPKKKLNLEEDKFVEALVNVPSRELEGYKLVDTQAPEKSYLLMKIKSQQGIVGDPMPVEAPPLKENEINTIETWVFSLAPPKIKKVKPTTK